MGVSFAEQLISFCSSVKGIHVDKIAKIESNPDRSKHLETARTTILGVELDFVNLRSEEYADHSRIPTQIVSFSPSQSHMPGSCAQAYPGFRDTLRGCNAS